MFGTVTWPPTAENLTRWARRLVPVVYVGCLIAFVADLTENVHFIPFGILYIPLVCTAVFHRNPGDVWRLAGGAIAMTIIGFFLPYINPIEERGVAVRALSIVAILIAAVLVRYARSVQDRLAEQTARTEAAERVKTEVFTTLSNELRTPLHAMIGLSEVMIAGCRPDQRLPLQQVQAGSKRLLATIDNLIDLTNLDEHRIAAEPVDLGGLVNLAAEASRTLASERQISVLVDLPTVPLTARADPWAVRRILDNLIANAVKFSPAGGVVELSAEHEPGSVVLLVRDGGVGMSAEILRRLGEPFFQADNGMAATGTGTGLALCRRLASSIGAELAFDSEEGCGTTATLRFLVSPG